MPPSLMTRVQSPGPIWGKERTDPLKLSSDHVSITGVTAHVHPHAHNTHKSNKEKCKNKLHPESHPGPQCRLTGFALLHMLICNNSVEWVLIIFFFRDETNLESQRSSRSTLVNDTCLFDLCGLCKMEHAKRT